MSAYLQQGPGFVFLFHPALGPLWEVIAQKLRGGHLLPRSELVLEVCCFSTYAFMHASMRNASPPSLGWRYAVVSTYAFMYALMRNRDHESPMCHDQGLHKVAVGMRVVRAKDHVGTRHHTASSSHRRCAASVGQ